MVVIQLLKQHCKMNDKDIHTLFCKVDRDNVILLTNDFISQRMKLLPRKNYTHFLI